MGVTVLCPPGPPRGGRAAAASGGGPNRGGGAISGKEGPIPKGPIPLGTGPSGLGFRVTLDSNFPKPKTKQTKRTNKTKQTKQTNKTKQAKKRKVTNGETPKKWKRKQANFPKREDDQARQGDELSETRRRPSKATTTKILNGTRGTRGSRSLKKILKNIQEYSRVTVDPNP